MKQLNIDILSPGYTKKILLLGAITQEREIFDSVVSINQSLFLTSHGKKYQIDYEGIVNGGADKSLLEFSISEVDEFKINNTVFTKFYACDDNDKNGIEINLICNDLKSLVFNSKENESVFNNAICGYVNLLENSDNIAIVSQAFVIILDKSKLDKNQCFGILGMNKKYFTKCSENEIKEILEIKKDKIKVNELEK